MSEKEMVNHPAHYQSKSGIEVIDVMEAFTEDLRGAEAVNTCQVIKYILRWKNKDKPLEDLKKCKWYLERLIDHVSNEDMRSTDNIVEQDFELLFETFDEATEFIEYMKSIITEYDFATISDMYEYLGVTDSYIDTKYGWSAIDNVTPYVVMSGFRVDLPTVKPVSELLNNKAKEND